MATEDRKESHGSETGHGGGGEKWSAELGEFVRRAPQFSALADVAEGRPRDRGGSRSKMLVEFAGRLAEGAARLKEKSSVAKEGQTEGIGDEST